MDHETKPNTSPESESVWSQLDTLLTDTQTHATIPTPQEMVSNIDVVIQDVERKHARQRRRRRLLVALMVLVFAISFMVIVCNVLVNGLVGDLKLGMKEMIADHPVTYTMPAAAQIIDQYTSKADWFGDFDYCATFRVSNAEYDQLLLNGFNWIYMGLGSTTPTPHVPEWQYGHLADLPLAGDCLGGLKPGLHGSTTYRYLFEKGEDWQKLLVVNEQEKIIFYYRSSW